MNKQEIEKALDGLKRMRITMFNYCIDGERLKPFLDTTISALEKQLTNGWIPVSERLPEEREEFEDIFDSDTLAVIDTKRYMVSDLVQVTVKDHEEDSVFVSDDCFVDGEWSYFDERTVRFEVLAWRPLPEPYKELATDNNVVTKSGKDNNVLTIGDKIRESN